MIPLITSSDHVIPIALVDPGQLTVNFSDKLYHCIDNHLGIIALLCCHGDDLCMCSA